MPNQAGTLEMLALEVGRALAPLEQRLSGVNALDLFTSLGMQFPAELTTIPGFAAALNTAGSAAGQIGRSLPTLATAIAGEDVGAIVREGAAVVQRIVALIDALDSLGGQIQAAAGALPGVSPAVVAAFVGDLALKLMEFMLVEYLDDRLAALSGLLTIFGLLERIKQPGVAGDASRPPFQVRRLRLDRLPALLGDTQNHFTTVFGWGRPDFDGRVMLQAIQAFLEGLGGPAILLPSPEAPNEVDALVLSVRRNPATTPPGLRAALRVRLEEGVELTQPLAPGWNTRVSFKGRMDAGTEATLTPPFGLALTAGAQFQAEARAGIIGQRPDGPLILIGQAGGTRLQANSVAVTSGVTALWNTATGRADGSFLVEAEFTGGKLVITLGGADGFLASILPREGLTFDFGFAMGWSGAGGFYFRGSSSMEIRLPVHIDLGPLRLSDVYLVLRLGASGLDLELASGITANLGPLVAAVERLGAVATLTFPGDSGNVPPANIAFRFKPPNGVGLAIDAGVVKGGGFLLFDYDRGEYAGALELTLSGFIRLTAVGVINTRFPDGSSGFSMLIIITAEFGTGIQLGFGFTLLGVGGLLGLNRAMRLEPLAQGVRSGSIDSIMFPQNVVANFSRIISDLRAIFPPEPGRFLIGPMLKIGWGTPTLVSLSLGLIIEIPGNIAIVGKLLVALPAADAPLIILQVSFIGAIEFDKQRGWFFATLFGSRVLMITLDGDMGLLIATGQDANFVLSVGGFHPRFNPPPLPFPNPNRITLDILNTPVARIRVMGYFAVTSNTVQFGARLELFFGLDACNVSGHLALDALFQFSPFYFIIEISGSISLSVFGMGLFSIRLELSLEGPTPWRARGSGTLEILFFEISADFDITWGEERDTTLPPISVIPLLAAELDKRDNWQTRLPAGGDLLVALAPIETDDLVLHPVGVLRVTQRTLPLDIQVDKVGAQAAADANRLSISVLSGGLTKQADIDEQFALAQYQNMSDADKLSRPGFQPQHGGVDLSASGRQMRSSIAVRRVVRYEEIITDGAFKRHRRRFALHDVIFVHLLAGAAVTLSSLSYAAAKQKQPFDDVIEVDAPAFTVASVVNNQAMNAAATFHSEASARDYLQRVAGGNRAVAAQYHVISSDEVVA